MGHLDGKVALVTGAGGQNGIGRAIAVRLAEDGAHVAVNDLVAKPREGSDWGGLPAVVAEIAALGRRSLAITADVADGGAGAGRWCTGWSTSWAVWTSWSPTPAHPPAATGCRSWNSKRSTGIGC